MKYKLVNLILISVNILEQVLLEHTSEHVKAVTGKSQHGFTKGKSCLTNLVVLCDRMTGFWGEGRTADAIYFGFRMVFQHCVPNILVAKLRSYSLGGC